MNKEHTGSRILKAQDGKSCHLGSTGVRFMIDGNDSSSRFSLVEHPMEPRALAAPLHRHRNEDEYSFVIEGRIGADPGGKIVFGDRGDLIFKPRWSALNVTVIESIIKNLETLPASKLVEVAHFISGLNPNRRNERIAALKATAGSMAGEEGEAFEKAVREEADRIDADAWK
jgi:mannose-6-phosphate isomerase-like protein (cupin superfamily)